MAEILGVGCTHYPPLITPDEDRGFPINVTLNHDERLPEELKNPLNWPEPMQAEYGDDQGLTSAAHHRARLVAGFRRVRQEILDFNPDFVVIFGDDQYENFREDIIPPFCVLAYDGFQCAPFTRRDGSPRRNVWDEPADKTFTYRGHPEAARLLAGGLLDSGVDMAYAYRPLHEPGLAHAFINTLLYLDYDREGFDFPVIPFAVNCYGRGVISNRGGILPHKVNGQTLEPDPPGPSAPALHGSGRRRGPRAAGKPLARRAGSLVKLVPRLPDCQEQLPLARRASRPRPLRRAPARQIRNVAQPHHRPDGSLRPARTAQLGLYAGGDERVGGQARQLGVRGVAGVHLQ